MSCRSNPGSSAMTSYARATSGLSDVQTLHLFHRLIREGRAQEAQPPNQQDLDVWRTQTRTALEGMDSWIPAGQRERIVRRIELLPSDFMPDGPTFHAWQNIRNSATASSLKLNRAYKLLALRRCGDEEKAIRQTEQIAAQAASYASSEEAARWIPPPDIMGRLRRGFTPIEIDALPQDKRTLYALNRLLEEIPATSLAATRANSAPPITLPTDTTQATTHAQLSQTRCPHCGQFAEEGSHHCPEAVNISASTPTPAPSAAPLLTQTVPISNATRPRWVQAAHEVRQNLTDQEQAQLLAAQEARVQEAARPSPLPNSAPRLSGPEGQVTYDSWVAEVRAVRAAGSGPPYETEAVLGEAATNFGVELEFKGADADVVARKLYEMGIAGHPQMVSYHHSCPQCQGKWKVERDGSVTNNRTGRNIGGEVVAPVLQDNPEHWQQLKQVADTIKELGGQCDNDTGQHVHISTASYDNQGSKYRNLAMEVAAQEDLLYRLSAPGQAHHRGLLRTDRPEYHYAQPIAPRLQQFLTKPNPALRTLLKAMRVYEIAHDRVPWAHYMSLNMQHVNEAAAGKSRVEFRTFNGTLDPVQIQTNVRLAAGLVHTAGQNEVSLPEGRGLGWHRQAHTDEEDSEQIRDLIDRLHLSESGAKAVLDTFLRGRWQYQNRAAVQQAS